MQYSICSVSFSPSRYGCTSDSSKMWTQLVSSSFSSCSQYPWTNLQTKMSKFLQHFSALRLRLSMPSFTFCPRRERNTSAQTAPLNLRRLGLGGYLLGMTGRRNCQLWVAMLGRRGKGFRVGCTRSFSKRISSSKGRDVLGVARKESSRKSYFLRSVCRQCYPSRAFSIRLRWILRCLILQMRRSTSSIAYQLQPRQLAPGRQTGRLGGVGQQLVGRGFRDGRGNKVMGFEVINKKGVSKESRFTWEHCYKMLGNGSPASNITSASRKLLLQATFILQYNISLDIIQNGEKLAYNYPSYYPPIIRIQHSYAGVLCGFYNKMEEFYRRKYLSPTYSRNASYVQTLEKDKTVAQLRKELQDCKEMEEKFDDLCLEIVKLERENKKLESDQSCVEAEYMTKVKANKARITELKQTILDYREKLQAKTARITALEAENEQLMQELQRIKKEAETNITQKDAIYQKLQAQEGLITEMKAKIDESRGQSAQIKKENQMKSEELEKSYQSFKRSELKLKEDELECEKTRQELEQLVKARQEWAKKAQISRLKMEAGKQELEAQAAETARLEAKHKQMQAQKERQSIQTDVTEKQLKSCISKSKEGCLKVKTCQAALLQAYKNLQKDQIYLQKMAVKEVQAKKGNERLQEVLSNLQEILSQEQQSYNRIISHMKFSIQQDEKAIESLSKQATLLEQMTN